MGAQFMKFIESDTFFFMNFVAGLHPVVVHAINEPQEHDINTLFSYAHVGDSGLRRALEQAGLLAALAGR